MGRKEWAKQRAEDLHREYLETGDMVAEIASIALANLVNDFSVNIAITGDTGVGKSTLAGQIALKIDPNTRPGTHYAYTRAEILDKARKLPEYTAMVVDEAIAMYKRRSLSSANVDVVELINKIRYRHVAMLWTLPHFLDLDRGIRKHVMIWVHVVKRGVAVALLRDRNPTLDDPWQLDALNQHLKEYLKDKGGAVTEPDDLLNALLAFPQAMKDPIYFSPLPTDFQKEYVQYSQEAKKRLEREDKEVYVTVPQAAQIIGIKKTRPIWELISEGQIKFIKTNPGALIPLSEALRIAKMSDEALAEESGPKMYTIAEISRLCGIPEMTLHRYVKKGQIPQKVGDIMLYETKGRRVLIPETAVGKFVRYAYARYFGNYNTI